MKEIVIEDFMHLEDAIDYLEQMLFNGSFDTSELDGEIKFINNKWRVGVTKNGRQKEFDFDNCG